jgi:predicted DNA-binding transcriptional regulator YafY
LVAILLMLQARGQVTAAEVAEELEVSERTARRDLDALGMAGIPVYSQQGRGGGWRLAGGGRTDLSGLSASEARALFLVAGPSSGATPEVKAALRKLVRALPEPLRTDAEAASAAVVVDDTGWGRARPSAPPPPHLDRLQAAVIEGEQVVIDYVARDGAATTRVVHPLGLVTKGRVWYLVGGTAAGMRTFRLERVRAVDGTGERVERPEGFDLAEAWRLVTDSVEERWVDVRAHGHATPGSVGTLRRMFGSSVQLGPTDETGRVEIEVRGPDAERLAGWIAGLGGAVVITDPPEVVERLANLAEELSAVYGTPPVTPAARSTPRARGPASTRGTRSPRPTTGPR